MPRARHKYYLLGLLAIILACNYTDRVVLSVVLEHIKADLRLSDTQLGVLSGIAFALFYSVMGLPIARWADRGNRVTIIGVTAALWSLAAAACGSARSFVQLMLIRIVVGVGEAGCIPPAHSLIADVFSRSERPRAVALYAQGGTLAMVVGYLAAGWLDEVVGWRATFVLVGLPGLLFAIVAWLTLQEPRGGKRDRDRGGSLPQGAAAYSGGSMASLREVCIVLWRNATFRHIASCFSISYFFGYGILQWQPTFFIRTHALTTGEVGTWLALSYGIVGGLGTYLGGEWASRYSAGDERRQLNVCAVSCAICAVLTAGSFLVAGARLAMGLLALANLAGYMSMGPMLATIQTLIAPRMRAMSIALLYLFANLFGMGLGPLAAGALSDTLRPWLGGESLRYALVLLCPGYIWAGWHLWRAGRTVDRDLARSKEIDPGQSAERPAGRQDGLIESRVTR